MTKLYGVMSVFNDIDCIQQCLPSLTPWVDELIIVDGPYRAFPYHGKAGRSDDGTWEWLQDYKGRCDKPVTLIEGRVWDTEMEKRTAYLNLIPDGDWWFMLDADEELISVCNVFHWGVGLIPLKEPWDCGIITALNPGEVITHHPRLFKKYRGMHYENGHVDLVNDETGREYNEMFIPVVIKNWGPALRKSERDEQRQAYYALGLP